jgi:hypothetical protein
MEVWCHPADMTQSIGAQLRNPDCTTAACAAGWMATCPTLIQQGFSLQPGLYTGLMVPAWREHRSWAALRECFELGFKETAWLFDPARYDDDSFEAVRERFQVFVKQRLQERIAATKSQDKATVTKMRRT